MSDQPEHPTYPDSQQPQQYQYPPPPPQQPPQKGGMGKWIALGGCGCLLFLAVAAGVGFFVYQMMMEPKEAVNAHLAALKIDVETAYNECSSGFKKETSLEQFESFVEGYPFLRAANEFSSSSINTKDGITTMDGSVEAMDGTKHAVEYRVVKEDGKHRVHFVQVKEPSAPAKVTEPQPPSGQSEPEIFDIGVEKSRSGDMITVRVTFQVQGFDNRRSGSNYSIHLVQDLETIGPDGAKIPSLSQDAIKTLTESGSLEYTSANFSNTLTIPISYPHGTYTIHLRVLDTIGGGSTEASDGFEFP